MVGIETLFEAIREGLPTRLQERAERVVTYGDLTWLRAVIEDLASRISIREAREEGRESRTARPVT